MMARSLLLLACLWTASAATHVSADEMLAPRPILTLDKPTEGATIKPWTTLNIDGGVSRGGTPPAEVLLVHVADDGRQTIIGLLTGSFRDDNRFGQSVNSGMKGWPVGKLRVIVRIAGMNQIAQERTLTVAPPVGEELEYRPPMASGVVIDFDRSDAAGTVPPGQSFLVRGTIPKAKLADRAGHQWVNADLGFLRIEGERRVRGGWVPLLRDRDDWWFESEQTAPDKAGEYVLRLRLAEGGAGRHPLLPDVTLKVAEPVAFSPPPREPVVARR